MLDGKALWVCASPAAMRAPRLWPPSWASRQEKVARQVAFVRCAGSTARDKGIYEGIPDCLAATKVAGVARSSANLVAWALATAPRHVSLDAIHLEHGVAKVDPDKCTGC